MTTTIRAAALCLALVAGGALADGVPLITPGSLKANDTARELVESKRVDFVKVHPVTLSKGSFGANVLTVVIDGKEYRFGGSLVAPVPPMSKTAPKQRAYQAWSGKEPGGGTLIVSRDTASGIVNVSMFLPPSRSFFSSEPPGGSFVLVEVDMNKREPLNFAPVPAPGLPASGSTR